MLFLRTLVQEIASCLRRWQSISHPLFSPHSTSVLKSLQQLCSSLSEGSKSSSFSWLFSGGMHLLLLSWFCIPSMQRIHAEVCFFDMKFTHPQFPLRNNFTPPQGIQLIDSQLCQLCPLFLSPFFQLPNSVPITSVVPCSASGLNSWKLHKLPQAQCFLVLT